MSDKLQVYIPGGGHFTMHIPESISIEDLEMISELCNLQMAAVQRHIYKRMAGIDRSADKWMACNGYQSFDSRTNND